MKWRRLQMNINQFEESIDPKILQRGKQYFLENRVRTTHILSENTYRLTVSGTISYKVTVESNNDGQILRLDCTCPYDRGPVCKHQVAALYTLKEKQTEPTGESVSDLLELMDKQTLIQTMVNWMKRYPELEVDIVFQTKKTDPKEQVTKIKQNIRYTINRYKGRDQFIHYNQSFPFIRDLKKSLDLIKHVKTPKESFTLLLYLYKETIKAIQYTDDSAGVITDLLHDIKVVILGKVLEYKLLITEYKKAILKKVKATIESNSLEGWPDAQVELLECFDEFLGEPKLDVLYVSIIDKQISIQKKKPYGLYSINQWLALKSQVIKKTESEETYQAFLQENKPYSSIRKSWFHWLMDKELYEKLIDEAKAAEKEDGALRGLVHEWKEYRYQAYKALNRTDEQKALAFEFLMDGNYDYYHELKALEDDQADLYQKIKNGFQQTNNWKAEETFLKIMLEEEDTKELLTYVQRNPYYITRFSELLYPIYPEEVEEAYQTVIKEQAKEASSRKEYRKVCQLITQYGKDTKKENKFPMIEELKEQNKRRPAFLDELGKVR